MATTTERTDFIQRGAAHWEEYQRRHDVSHRRGQFAGIDPHTGEVFLGGSAAEIAKKLLAEGRHRPLYFVRVGDSVYARRVGKRCSRAK